MPCANTEAMNKHLEEIGKAVTPGAHAALIFDGAGWHDSADLVMPENITPVILPPYSAGTQSRRECLGIFTQEQARQSPLRNLRGYCRSLLRRLEQAHGDAGPHRIHCRKNLGWSNSQVLVRFMLLHLGLSALLVTLVLKVR